MSKQQRTEGKNMTIRAVQHGDTNSTAGATWCQYLHTQFTYSTTQYGHGD